MTKGEIVVGYIRVSSDSQGESGAGLEAQRAAIEGECSRRGWVLERIEEDVASAKTTNGRPGLERALASCRSGDVSGLVVSKLDRVTRSVVDLGRMIERAKREGWNLVALDFGLDLSTPQGKLVANVLVSVSEWEREIIGQRTREALAVKRAQGVRLGRPRTVPESVRRRIRVLHEAGRSYAGIARMLDEEGVATGQGGRWHANSVRRIVVGG
jgi:DNA invertase Pin-like site-specific DNA recombinase